MYLASGPSTTDHQPQWFAVKIFDLTNSEQAYWISKCLRNEMYISKNLKHPNIVLTYEVFKTHRNGFIVMDFAVNGNIETELYNRLRRPFTESEAKSQFSGLMAGLQHMHNVNIAHRDLKLENFLLNDKNIPMISDFGFAALGCKQSSTVLTKLIRKTPCGTSGYMAPELYMGTRSSSESLGYDAKSVDIYAMGVCLYEMTNLGKPFSGDRGKKVIINQEIRYQVELCSDLKDLIVAMLQIDANRRPNVDDVIQSKWLNPDAFTQALNWFGLRQ